MVLGRNGQGEVYLVGSTCSMLSYIGYAAYAPSKYAIKGLADGLRLELKRNNIHVGCIYPPNMDTPCLRKENETKPEEGLYVESKFETLYSPSVIAKRVIRHMKRVGMRMVRDYQGDPHIYGDLDAWGVGLSNFGLGPANNFFFSVLFVIPAMICTGAFRLLLSFVYTRKRFFGEDSRKKWTAGDCVNEKTWPCLFQVSCYSNHLMQHRFGDIVPHDVESSERL